MSSVDTSTTTNDESGRWLHKVRLLLAKAEDPGCTAEEAEALTAKATELMAKYGVNQALLDAQTPERRATPINRWFLIPDPYSKDKLLLLNAIGEALGCQRVFFRDRNGRRLHMFGFASDIDRVEILYTSLLVQMANAVAQAQKPIFEDPVSFKKSFMQGFTNTVFDRLTASEARAKHTAEEQRPAGSTSVALVLADRAVLVQRAKDDAYPKLRRAQKRRLTSADGIKQGIAAGQRADIGGARITDTPDAKALAQG